MLVSKCFCAPLGPFDSSGSQRAGGHGPVSAGSFSGNLKRAGGFVGSVPQEGGVRRLFALTVSALKDSQDCINIR